jgi:hypothetical protein
VTKKLGLAVLLLSLSGAASAGGTSTSCQPIWFFGVNLNFWCSAPPPPGQGSGGPAVAPEIDPASALSGLTLALGGLAVLRARRFKLPKQ